MQSGGQGFPKAYKGLNKKIIKTLLSVVTQKRENAQRKAAARWNGGRPAELLRLGKSPDIQHASHAVLIGVTLGKRDFAVHHDGAVPMTFTRLQ